MNVPTVDRAHRTKRIGVVILYTPDQQSLELSVTDSETNTGEPRFEPIQSTAVACDLNIHRGVESPQVPDRPADGRLLFDARSAKVAQSAQTVTDYRFIIGSVA